jgi:hypothetical protein
MAGEARRMRAAAKISGLTNRQNTISFSKREVFPPLCFFETGSTPHVTLMPRTSRRQQAFAESRIRSLPLRTAHRA